MKKISKTSLLIALVLPMTFACSKKFVEIQYDGTGFMDGDIHRKVTVDRITKDSDAANHLIVKATLINHTDYNQEIEGRISFFNQFKTLVEGPTVWRRLYFNPRSIEELAIASTATEEIKYFYLELREGK